MEPKYGFKNGFKSEPLYLAKCSKNNNDSEHGPNVPNSMFTYKGKLVSVQNLTCSNSLETTNKLKQ
jgi:hypothetical protein